MRIKTKILWTLLGMSLLVAVMGAFAVNRQRAAAMAGVIKEAEDVARVVSFLLVSDSDKFSTSAQEIVTRLHHTQGRDVVLLDSNQRVLADAVPSEVGTIFGNDPGDEVGATIKDRQMRTFVEVSRDYPAGIKQIVVPVEGGAGRVIGAVVLEYTPVYNEMMRSMRSTIHEVVLAGLGSVIIALLIATYMGRSIARPLQQLTNVATELASGRVDLPMPPPRKDEIGELAAAFNNMVQKRQQAENELWRLRDKLEVRVSERTAELADANESLLVENAERKRAEETLRESEEKFLQLAENITDVFWIRSPDMREVHYVSPAYERIWGRSVEDLQADPLKWANAIAPEDRENVLAIFGTLMGPAPSISVEYRIVRPDGEMRWIHVRGFQVRDAAGELIRLTGVVTDITGRKRSEADLEKAHKKLLEVSRQAGMAEVATSVLHNVGNVLNSVNVSATLIAKSVRRSRSTNLTKVVSMLREHEGDLGSFLATDPKGRQIPDYLAQLSEHLSLEQTGALKELDGLRKNIEHIKDIVAMQQSYAKVSGVTETVRVADLVEDALTMNAGAFQRHDVEILRDFAEVPGITVEKHKVLQILVNLMRNARYACDDGGSIDKRMTVRVSNGAGRIKITVADNGVGIHPENLTRIFQHGFTTRKDGHGFGLHSGALAAKELGGELHVHSDGPGKGAEFTLELPLNNQAGREQVALLSPVEHSLVAV